MKPELRSRILGPQLETLMNALDMPYEGPLTAAIKAPELGKDKVLMFTFEVVDLSVFEEAAGAGKPVRKPRKKK